MSHSNIALFVPHIGCPCRCSFCDQHSITMHAKSPSENDVHNAVNNALQSKNYNPNEGQIAFFGGSFTAINRDYMLSLLKSAKEHIDNGDAKGIRISTRPDCIDREILDILKKHSVTSIELGAQSMSDNVLKLNQRGHSSDDVRNACKLIHEYDIELGLQMMTGLYGDDDDNAIYTANELIKLSPKTARIYPTVVFKNTMLDKLRLSGEYIPQTVENAVKLGAKLIPMFEENDIDVIRFGLHEADECNITGGAWHPAIAQLVQSEIIKENVVNQLSTLKKGEYEIGCSPKKISDFIGQKRANIKYFELQGYKCIVKANANLKGRQFTINERKH